MNLTNEQIDTLVYTAQELLHYASKAKTLELLNRNPEERIESIAKSFRTREFASNLVYDEIRKTEKELQASLDQLKMHLQDAMPTLNEIMNNNK